MAKASVVIVAYGDEPWLARCVTAVLDSRGVDVEVLVVDNGSSSVDRIAPNGRIQILRPGTNTGFAGGCNFAARHAQCDLLVFVNSDLVVDPDALKFMTSRLNDDSLGLVTGTVLLASTPRMVNSVGNPIHFLMFSWSGSYGEPHVDYAPGQQVAGVSGAFFACTMDHWQQLGGFDDQYVAYAEDVDLSIRTWQRGWSVVFEPRALAAHHYEFSRNRQKWYFLERNRLINFFTLYDASSVVLLLPIFLPIEFGVFLSSLRGGWTIEKLASWRWLLRHRAYLRERSSLVTSAKEADAVEWTMVLSAEMRIPREFGLHVPGPINWVMRLYWLGVKRWIR